jgi:hypothetical protein
MNKLKYAAVLAVSAFFLHLIWENIQAPLYDGYQSFSQHIPICFIGTLGDVLITLLVFAFLWLLKKDLLDTRNNFFALAIIGFVIAVAIEQHALLLGKWSYTATMPIIPWLGVGLTPIIQMTILLPLSFYIAGLFNKKHENV